MEPAHQRSEPAPPEAVRRLEELAREGLLARVASMGERDRALASWAAGVERRLAEHQGVLEAFNRTLVRHEELLAQWEARRARLAEVSAQVAALASHADALRQEVERTSARLEAGERQREAAATEILRLVAKQDEKLRTEAAVHAAALGAVQERLAEDAAGLEAVRAAGRELGGAVARVGAELKVLLDERGPDRPEWFAKFYLAFEDRFRGSREEVLRKLRAAYLPEVTRALAQSGVRGWRDLGCGRGEWLEVLAGAGAEAVGVDSSPEMVAHCAGRGLAVEHGDALERLAAVPTGTLAGVSAFHLVEHLPYRKMLALVDAAFAALAPGGCLVFETPNPQNVSVGACNFYMDVTHQKPIPPMTAEFIATHAGFREVRVLRLSPFARHAERDSLPTVTDREYCEMFYGPQDYAIVAFK